MSCEGSLKHLVNGVQEKKVVELWLDQAAFNSQQLSAVHWETRTLHDRQSLFDLLNHTAFSAVKLKARQYAHTPLT